MILPYLLPAVLLLIAGMADGLNQVLQFRYDKFADKFKKVNDNYWQPELSYLNKYKDGIAGGKPKFFGSTTFLVWLTDGFHLTRFIGNLFIMASIVTYPGIISNVWLMALVGAILWTIYRAGFSLVYYRF